MIVTRRTALKQFLILTGGVLVVPSCMHRREKASIALKHLDVSADQEKLIAEMAETIIPATDTPGAKDVYVQQFILRMMDDCYEPKKQQQFMSGLKAVDETAKQRFSKSFINCTSQERTALVTELDQKKQAAPDLQAFYHMMKNLTIQGYMTSKYVMTKQVIYELVPGRFHGSFPVAKTLNT